MKSVALALATAAMLAGAPALADDAGAPKPTPPTRPTPPTKPTVPGKGVPAGKPAATGKPAPAKPAPAKPAPAPATKPAPGKPAPAKPAPAKPDSAKPENASAEPKRPDEDAFDDDDGKPASTAPASTAPATAASTPAAPAAPIDVHAAPPPDQSYSYRHPVILPTITWLAFQLLPSPEIVVGRQRSIAADGSRNGGASATWGVRWQLTPLLWSWGVHRKQSPWRMVEVDPLARVAGSVEVWTAVEYIGGEISRPFIRPGVRAFFPLIDRGEYLSTSIGTSIYRFDNALRVAYDVGFYVFSGIFGVNFTIAPTHAPMTSIITFNMRYF